ncbi:diguanylate cyclase domain-containing protein [Pseudoalteromonas atlantica]|uniref:sensor domain-containing diguanylate cyclase n=1 Tax=Pseudoalteromonas atlantica TaxID=288 RepID=UPI00373688C4
MSSAKKQQDPKVIWRTLQALPYAIIMRDSSSSVYSNALAMNMFNLPEQIEITSEKLKHITITSTLSRNTTTLATFLSAEHALADDNFLISPTQNKVCIKLTKIDNCTSIYIFDLLNDTSKSDKFDEVIAKISSQLIDIQSDSIDNKIEGVLQTIGTFCQADRSYLFQFSQDGMLMSNTHEWVNDTIIPFKQRLQNIPQEALPYFFSKLKSDGVFIVSDVNKLPHAAAPEKAEFQAEGIKSLLCIALHSENALFGFIGCDCVSDAHDWTETDLIRIKLVGEILTSALKNASYKLHIEQMQQQLIKVNKELETQANIDSLTSIANRRRFDQTLKTEILRAARAHQPLSLIICDIDYFKPYNDNYGHQQGDQVLKKVAKALHTLCKREGDLAARYGGEEFAIILPCLDQEQCSQFAQLLQKCISELQIAHHFSTISKNLTLSIGCYTCIPEKTTTEDSMILAADSALYIAKNSGRNTISIFDK